MKVLLVGGTGFVGSVISSHLHGIDGIETIIAARKPPPSQYGEFRSIDATSAESLRDAVAGVDVIVNCVTGSSSTIRNNALAIVSAASRSPSKPSIVHMSSMAVYGDMQGELDESVVLTGNGNWYGQAKMEAEEIFREYANEGGASTMFRIGCVYGACSVLWVDRIGLLIRRGRLGDLAQYADGWSNLVHVNDISRAVLARIKKPSQGFEIYNLSAPDSPRWNTYFRDFCIAMDCTPLRYKTRFSMLIESKIVAPPLKLLERLSRSGLVPAHRIHSIPPSLLRLWAQHIRLISSRIEKSLQLEWTPYSKGLSDSIEYFRSKYNNE